MVALAEVVFLAQIKLHIGGLVVILLTLLGFGIAAVTLGLKKRGE